MDITELAEHIVEDDRMSGVPRYEHRYSETERRLASAVVRKNTEIERLRGEIELALDAITLYGDETLHSNLDAIGWPSTANE